MVTDTLALAKKEQFIPTTARFRIGEYEWCEPDYRQILIWAKTLRLEPEEVIQRLQDGKDDGLVPAESWGGTQFADGRLLKINWDFELLRMEDFEYVLDGVAHKDQKDFEWVEGLRTTHLSFSCRKYSEPLYGKTLKVALPELTHLACPGLGVTHLNLSSMSKLF